MNFKGNEKILRRIFEVLIRIEKFLIKHETKEEPKE
jgi:hypothetical protein